MPGWPVPSLELTPSPTAAARDSAGQASLVSQFMTIQYLIFSCLISALKTGFQHHQAAQDFAVSHPDLNPVSLLYDVQLKPLKT